MSLRHAEFIALINQIHQLRHGTPITELARLCGNMFLKTKASPIPCFCGNNDISKLEIRNNTWWISDRNVCFVISHILSSEENGR